MPNQIRNNFPGEEEMPRDNRPSRSNGAKHCPPPPSTYSQGTREPEAPHRSAGGTKGPRLVNTLLVCIVEAATRRSVNKANWLPYSYFQPIGERRVIRQTVVECSLVLSIEAWTLLADASSLIARGIEQVKGGPFERVPSRMYSWYRKTT